MAVDLHMHSVNSDGTRTPRELVGMSKDLGLTVIALTDHDTMGGAEAFRQAGHDYDMCTVEGVELSCVYGKKEIHVLGYGRASREFDAFLAPLRDSRKIRNTRMIRRLQELGYSITEDAVAARAAGKSASRVHIAQELVENGYAESISDAFERLVGNGRPGYIQRETLSVEEGVDSLVRFGFVPVLAHPMEYDLTDEELNTLLALLIAHGLEGMEVIHSECTYKDHLKLAAKADALGLLKTGGSDYHGANKPDVPLGVGMDGQLIPDAYAEALLDRLHSKRV